MISFNPLQTHYWLVLVVIVALSGCRAMETHDIDGQRYNNESRSFYVNGKNSTLHRRSYAYSLGEFDGLCNSSKSNNGQASKILDTAVLKAVALFDTDDSTLTDSGKAVLDQLLLRVDAYENVEALYLAGYTDKRANINYNKALSMRRNVSVRSYLADRLPANIAMEMIAFGKKYAETDISEKAQLQLDRRVEIRIVANGVKANNKDKTVCHQQGNENTPGSNLRVNSDLGESQRQLAEIQAFRGPLPISTGDRLRLNVAGDSDFDGIYEVGIGGGIQLPYLDFLPVKGLSIPAIRLLIETELVNRDYFRPGLVDVSIVVQQWSAADVYVRGAVFNPGRKTINGRDAEQRAFNQTQISGDSARDRLLSTALYSAGGVRPDADLTNIEVQRGARSIRVNLSGVISGSSSEDFPLISGDNIIVHSSGFFQDELMQVSQITPPGVRVYISNLTSPAESNAQSAVGKDSASLPYGTRMLHALLSANCVGGIQYTNSARRAVLISTNPLTGRTEVIERSIQQLVSDPDRDDINPHLMPNDGVACYDSEVTNIRDIARSFSDVLSPFVALRILFP